VTDIQSTNDRGIQQSYPSKLQDARDTITRLTAHQACSIGWDTPSRLLREREDMQQLEERDAETHRARLAES